MRKKGFTLIELLVVIAIIALLMAILMPALEKVKKLAKDVIGRSRLKQWASISQVYTDEHDSKFMVGRTDPFGDLGLSTVGEGDWFVQMRGYYGDADAQLLSCPMALKPGKAVGNAGMIQGGQDSAWVRPGYYPPNAVYQGSYGMNCWAYNYLPVSQDPEPSKPTKDERKWAWRTPNIKGANRVPLFLDCIWYGITPKDPLKGDEAPPLNPDDYSGGMGRACIDRHEGKINITFMDWSVRGVYLKQLWAQKWHRQWPTGGGATVNPWVKTLMNIPAWPGWMESFPDGED